MAGHDEEFEDIIDAHDAVIFLRDVDVAADAAIRILSFIGLVPHVVDLTGQFELEEVVRANMADLDLPAIFLNGQYFSDAFVLLDIAASDEFARYLNATGVDYDARAVRQIRTANQ